MKERKTDAKHALATIAALHTTTNSHHLTNTHRPSTMSTPHHAGFIALLGKPNAGKSTLFNKLVQHPLAITTHKAQTTRHSLLGIVQDTHHQAIYMDTPGYLDPTYPLQEVMMQAVNEALTGADLAVWVVDVRQQAVDEQGLALLHPYAGQLVLLLNKCDLVDDEKATAQKVLWERALPSGTPLFLLSAFDPIQVTHIADYLRKRLPQHPPYYDKGTLTDRPYRFFAAQILRKAIFLHYHQEVPYSSEVTITHFAEEDHIIHIHATIHVARQSQKKILIGKQGSALKEVGISARKELERFLGKKVFLAQHVKVLDRWREKTAILQRLGYG